MKKILRNSLGILLAGSALFATACGGPGANVLPPFDSNTYTDYYLAQNGETEYSIVIDDKASEFETFAAEELQTLFKEATGATLPIHKDNEIDLAQASKVISIGDNDFQKAKGVTVDYSRVKATGGIVNNQGENVFLLGGSDTGSLYMTYEFLETLFNYQYYEINTYTINKVTEKKLPVLTGERIPSFERVMFGDFSHYNNLGGDVKTAYRQRFYFADADSALSGHTASQLLPRQNFPDKTDWFSTMGGDDVKGDWQICYTSEGALEEYIAAAKRYLSAKPETISISFNDRDYNTWCGCSRCQEVLASYDLKDANGEVIMKAPNTVTGVIFKSRAAWAIDEWLAEEYPGRVVKYYSHAYFQQRTPPVYATPEGEYILLTNGEADDPLANVNPNMIFEVAAIEANRNYSWEDNKSQGEELKKWAVVTPGIMVYDYVQDAQNVLCPYDGLHTHADNMRYVKSIGHTVYKYQGNFNTQSGGFYDLRKYVISKLAWNVDADVDTLVNNYLKACYGPAYEYMKELYTSQRTNIARCREQSNYGGHCLGSYVTNGNWSRELMLVYEGLIEKAYDAIDYIKYESPEYYARIFRRIKIEELTVQYINLSLYRGMYSYEEKMALISDFETYSKMYGATLYHESKPMSEKFAEWRAN